MVEEAQIYKVVIFKWKENGDKHISWLKETV